MDDQLLEAMKGASKEADKWKDHIPRIDKGIQAWHEVEAKAWEQVKYSI